MADMKIKIILILIAFPFLLAFAGDQFKAPAADSTGRADTAILGSVVHPTTEIDNHPRLVISGLSQVSVDTPQVSREGESGPRYNRANREKAKFVVCAGRYTIRENAERHLESLAKLGYSPKLKYDGQKEYWVVLKKVMGISRAEKVKAQFQKSGITCFIEEE